MDKLMLFTDGSVNPKSNIGYGAFLSVKEMDLPLKLHIERVQIKRFENTTSTKLELQTLLWALSESQNLCSNVIVHTDSQNIVGLPGRRELLELNDYCSKKNKSLKNHNLYRKFYILTDKIECDFIKMRGHKGANQLSKTEKLFSLVDRASRNALRRDHR